MAEDELWKTLIRFHREIVKPDVQEIVDKTIRELRNDDIAHFNGRDVTVFDLDKLLDEVEFAGS